MNRSARFATFIARLTRSDWRLEPCDALIRIDVPGEPGAMVSMHYFVPEEVEREAAQAGLRVLCHDSRSTAYAVLGR